MILKSKRGVVGETITWVFAFLIIFFISLLFLTLSSYFSVYKRVVAPNTIEVSGDGFVDLDNYRVLPVIIGYSEYGNPVKGYVSEGDWEAQSIKNLLTNKMKNKYYLQGKSSFFSSNAVYYSCGENQFINCPGCDPTDLGYGKSIPQIKVFFNDKDGKEKSIYFAYLGECEDEVQEQILPPQEDILEFKGDGTFEVLSEEECKNGLQQRKKDLGIPEKLCYWETMTQVYKDKCTNLNEAQIKEIFEKKAEYRKLNNPDWPNLNTEGDFCVSVIYDCGEWKKTGKNNLVFGFSNSNSKKENEIDNLEQSKLMGGLPSVSGNPSGEIQINPYLKMSKEIVQNTILLHEGLHSIQSRMYENTHLAEGVKYTGISSQYNPMKSVTGQGESLKIQEKMIPYTEILAEKLSGVQEAFASEMNDIALSSQTQEDKTKKIDELDKQIEELFNIQLINIPSPSQRIYDPVELEEYYGKNVKVILEKYNVFDAEAQEAYSKILELNSQAYFLFNEVRIKGYVGEKREVDPRLSEVQRWWLDKTAPNCEVITTKEKAKEVLDKFLVEKNIDEVYRYSQSDLSLLLYVYKGTEFEQEVYDAMINRLPGLAMNENEEDTAYA